MTVLGNVRRRWETLPLAWLAVAFTLAQAADLLSAMVVARELNPIAAGLVAQPILGVVLKLALVGFVVATAEICDRNRPGLARLVLVVGTIAGLVGALSNTQLTPFLSA